MKLLVVGGAGYIGSHVVLHALEKGCQVTVFDNLSTGYESNLFEKADFFLGSTLSISDLSTVMQKKYDGVIHLAASKAAGESMLEPHKYANNNIIGGLNLINQSMKNGIKAFLFSSSAAVYGIPEYNPVDENHKLNPINYYGFTKLLIEQNLKWFSDLNFLRFASLRYFNASGYDLKKRITSIEKNPQNLIPVIM